MINRFVRGLSFAIFLLSLMGAFAGSAPALETRSADSGIHGWWAVTGPGIVTGPFSDGISAALYSQHTFWPEHPAEECYYGYNPVSGSVATSTCIGYTSGGSVRPGGGFLTCALFGELGSEGGGGCISISTRDAGMPACHEEIGNPVNLISGNKYQNVTDFSSAGPQPLRLTRSYNSQAAYHATKISHGRFGRGWRTEYDAKALYFATDPADPQRIHIILPGGREAVFQKASGVLVPAYFNIAADAWRTPRKDVDESVTLIGGTIWRYTGADDTA